MDDIMQRIGKLLTTRFGVSPAEFGAEMTLEELDLDSLALVELALVAEKEFGVKLGEQEFSPADTVADMAKRIASKAI